MGWKPRKGGKNGSQSWPSRSKKNQTEGNRWKMWLGLVILVFKGRGGASNMNDVRATFFGGNAKGGIQAVDYNNKSRLRATMIE